MCYMKGHEASITFHQKTWYQPCLVFVLLALKTRQPQKLIFYTLIFEQKLDMLHYTCNYTESFPHSYAKLNSLVFNKSTTL